MKKNSYQILYLNGPSSSGKTKLSYALQEALDKPFLYIGIDKIITMMPSKLNDWQGGPAPDGFSWKESKTKDGLIKQELQMGPFAHKIADTYKEIVKTLAKLEHYLIIDDVAFGKKEVDKWRDLLKEYKVLFVKIDAPLEIMIQREKERKDRIIGSARAQAEITHKGVDYDLEIDTHHQSIDENVKKIIQALNSAT